MTGVCEICGQKLGPKATKGRCAKHHRGPDPAINPNRHHRAPRTPDVSKTDEAKRYEPEGEKL